MLTMFIEVNVSGEARTLSSKRIIKLMPYNSGGDTAVMMFDGNVFIADETYADTKTLLAGQPFIEVDVSGGDQFINTEHILMVTQLDSGNDSKLLLINGE